MNPEAIGVIKHHLRTATENLARLALWPTDSDQARMHNVVFDSIKEASRLLESWKTNPANAEVGIRINIDTGDTVERLNLCNKAMKDLINTKKELDILFSGEYGLQYTKRGGR